MITNITLTNKIYKGIISIALDDGSAATTVSISNGTTAWQVNIPTGGTAD